VRYDRAVQQQAIGLVARHVLEIEKRIEAILLVHSDGEASERSGHHDSGQSLRPESVVHQKA
jgi:hypothetical protein